MYLHDYSLNNIHFKFKKQLLLITAATKFKKTNTNSISKIHNQSQVIEDEKRNNKKIYSKMVLGTTLNGKTDSVSSSFKAVK